MTKIEQILKSKAMTQSDLYRAIAADYKTPVPKYAISKIVTGKLSNYSMSTLVKISTVLQVNPSDIIEFSKFKNLLKNG